MNLSFSEKRLNKAMTLAYAQAVRTQSRWHVTICPCKLEYVHFVWERGSSEAYMLHNKRMARNVR
jgi:hypothetical protein